VEFGILGVSEMQRWENLMTFRVRGFNFAENESGRRRCERLAILTRKFENKTAFS
jgi:hypothetical protein